MPIKTKNTTKPTIGAIRKILTRNTREPQITDDQSCKAVQTVDCCKYIILGNRAKHKIQYTQTNSSQYPAHNQACEIFTNRTPKQIYKGKNNLFAVMSHNQGIMSIWYRLITIHHRLQLRNLYKTQVCYKLFSIRALHLACWSRIEHALRNRTRIFHNAAAHVFRLQKPAPLWKLIIICVVESAACGMNAPKLIIKGSSNNEWQ